MVGPARHLGSAAAVSTELRPGKKVREQTGRRVLPRQHGEAERVCVGEDGISPGGTRYRESSDKNRRREQGGGDAGRDPGATVWTQATPESQRPGGA